MILVGTLHSDWKGSVRLERILREYKPKIITVEAPNLGNADGLISRIETARHQLKNNIPKHFRESYRELISKAIDNYCYECIIPINYAKSSACNLQFVDNSKVVKSKFMIVTNSYCPPLATKSFVLKLANLPGGFLYTYLLEFIYTHLTDIMYKEIIEERKNCSPFSNADTEERENCMANELLNIRPDMHIGGLIHIFGKFPGNYPVKPLYQRLGSIVKKRIMLCDADQLIK